MPPFVSVSTLSAGRRGGVVTRSWQKRDIEREINKKQAVKAIVGRYDHP